MGEIQRLAEAAGLFSGTLLSSCQTEIQELMQQIDLMVLAKKGEWQRELEALQLQANRDRATIGAQKAAVEAKGQEARQLGHQLEGMAKSQRDLVQQYEREVTRLQGELAHLKREYQRVDRHHGKQLAEAEKQRQAGSGQLRQALEEARQARLQLEEYRAREKEWEVERIACARELGEAESERNTTAEKCLLAEEQAASYRDQLQRTKLMLEDLEVNTRGQVTRLEQQLSRQRDVGESKEEEMRRLRALLEQAGAEREAGLRQKGLLEDSLAQVRLQLGQCRGEIGRLEGEVVSRDDLLQAARLAREQQSGEILRLEETVQLQESQMSLLEETAGQQLETQVGALSEQLRQVQKENRKLKKGEEKLERVVQDLTRRLEAAQAECADLGDRLAAKLEEEGAEIQALSKELGQARKKSQSQEQYFGSELGGMKAEISSLMSDLHQRNSTVASLSHRVSQMEQQLREKTELETRLRNEAQVTTAQLDALRVENRYLREASLSQKLSSAKNLQATETHVSELNKLQQDYSYALEGMQTENTDLRNQLERLQHQSTVNQQDGLSQYEELLNKMHATVADLREKERSQADRLQRDFAAQLKTVTEQHREEVQFLEDRIERLRAENAILKEELAKHYQAKQKMETIVAHSPARGGSPTLGSSAGTFAYLNRLQGGVLKGATAAAAPDLSERDRPGSRASVTDEFSTEEWRRSQHLQDIIDTHIVDLEKRTEETVTKYNKP